MKLFLIGLPGSGKTTLGKELAKKLASPFVDLDTLVEAKEKQTIQNIFKDHGEDYFRRVEATVLKDWCGTSEEFVMATGGGTPCFFDNMEQINKAGKSIFLDVPAHEIATRLKRSSQNKRPLFENLYDEELKAKIESLRSQRIQFYQKAHHHIVSDRVLFTDILSLI